MGLDCYFWAKVTPIARSPNTTSDSTSPSGVVTVDTDAQGNPIVTTHTVDDLRAQCNHGHVSADPIDDLRSLFSEIQGKFVLLDKVEGGLVSDVQSCSFRGKIYDDFVNWALERMTGQAHDGVLYEELLPEHVQAIAKSLDRLSDEDINQYLNDVDEWELEFEELKQVVAMFNIAARYDLGLHPWY